MKKNLFKMLLPLACIGLLASCSDNKKIVDLNLKYVTAKTAPTETVDKDAQAQVAQAATAVGQSLQHLSAMQMANQPRSKMRKPLNAKFIGMGQLASVSWTGPAEPLLQKIAKATHYRLRVIGDKPAVPVLISINMQNQPVASILRNVIYQVVSKASVAVYPKSRTIELRYHGN